MNYDARKKSEIEEKENVIQITKFHLEKWNFPS